MNYKIRRVVQSLSIKQNYTSTSNRRQKFNENEIQLIKQYSRLRSMQYKKSLQTRKIIEDLYFTDYAEDMQTQILEEQQDQEDKIQKALKVDSQTKYRNMVESQTQNQDNSSPYYINIIQQNQNNHLLLNYFKDIHQNIDQQVIHEVFKKVVFNFQNQEQIKQRELTKYEQKKNKLKSINKKINIEFSLKFLNKEQLVNHQGYQLMITKMIDFIKQKCDQDYQKYHLLLSILTFTRFDTRNNQQMHQIISSLFDWVSSDILELENGQIKIILDISLELYQNKFMNRNQIKIVKNLIYEISERDLRELNHNEIFKIIKTQRSIRYSLNKQLLYRLEPYILKLIREFSISQKIDILINYLLMKSGTEQFIRMIYNDLIQNSQSLNQIQCMKILKKMNKREMNRFMELQLYNLIKVVVEQLIRNLHQQQVELEDVMHIQNQLQDCQIYNKNYYELLSVIIVKLNQKQSLESNYLGYQCMQWLSHNNISSSVLLNMIKKQLNYQTKQQVFLQISSHNGQEDQEQKEQKELINSFEFQVNQLWSYTYQIMMQREQKNTDFDVYNQCCFKIEQILSKIHSQIQLSRVSVEKIDQINFYIRNESYKMLLRPIQYGNIRISESEQEMIQQKVEHESLYELEKQYFLQKYEDDLQKYIRVNDYMIDFSLVKQKKQLYLFINDKNYSQSDYGQNVIIKNGVYELRSMFMQKVLQNIEYIDIEYNKMIEDSVYRLNQNRIGYIEYLIQQEGINIELKEDNQYSDVLDQILDLRLKIFNKGDLVGTDQLQKDIQTIDQKDINDDDDDDLFDQYIDSSDAEYQ